MAKKPPAPTPTPTPTSGPRAHSASISVNPSSLPYGGGSVTVSWSSSGYVADSSPPGVYGPGAPGDDSGSYSGSFSTNITSTSAWTILLTSGPQVGGQHDVTTARDDVTCTVASAPTPPTPPTPTPPTPTPPTPPTPTPTVSNPDLHIGSGQLRRQYIGDRRVRRTYIGTDRLRNYPTSS